MMFKKITYILMALFFILPLDARAADEQAPSAPVLSWQLSRSSASVILRWKGATDNTRVRGYKIYRDGVFIRDTELFGFMDGKVKPGAQYSYLVKAYDAAGNLSPASNTIVASIPFVSATVPVIDRQPPSVPSGLTAIARSPSEVQLNWNPSTDNVGVVRYNIFRNNELIRTLRTNSFVDIVIMSSLIGSRYTVAAIDAAGNESAKTAVVTVVNPNPEPEPDPAPAPDTQVPSVPSGLTAIARSPSEVQLNWNRSTDNRNIVRYKVFRNDELISTVRANSFTDIAIMSSLIGSRYAVSAVDGVDNESVKSATVIVVDPNPEPALDVEAPSVPNEVSVRSRSSTEVQLNWNSSTDNVGVQGYRVRRNGINVSANLNLQGTSYVDRGLSTGIVYAYTIEAFDAQGNVSNPSRSVSITLQPPPDPEPVPEPDPVPTPDTQAPTVPTALTAVASSLLQVQLNWNVSNDNVGVVGYKVFRNNELIRTVDTNSFVDIAGAGSLIIGSRYAVSAIDAARNESAKTEVVVVVNPNPEPEPDPVPTPDTQAPTVPSGITLNPISSSQINLSWSPSSDNVGVSFYSVYRNGAYIGRTTATSYFDNGLLPKTTYFYTISAQDAAGNVSMQSLSQSTTTLEATSKVNYDIVYVRTPRYGDHQGAAMPEIKDPTNVEPGSDLVLLHPDGREEVLVAAGKGAVMDPYVSFDGQWVYYAFVHDQVNIGYRRVAYSGADIFKINLKTKQIIQLTHGEWTPNTGAGDWATDPLRSNGDRTKNYFGAGIYNVGPCPVPGGKIIFTSNRNGFTPNKFYTNLNLQLFIMDEDGKNVQEVGFLNEGSALHPTILTDGRVMFASYEAQGLKDIRLWSLWSIWPDGRHWDSLVGDFMRDTSFHGQGQLSDGSIVAEEYYNQNNNGFGMFYKFPSVVPKDKIAFGSPNRWDPSNPTLIWAGFDLVRFPFTPYGMEVLTEFTNPHDMSAPFLNGERTGKVRDPAGAPNNDLLLVWSPGPATFVGRPTNYPLFDAGIYLLQGGVKIKDPKKLVLIKNDPNYNEIQPRAVVPYKDIYGIDEPKDLSLIPDDAKYASVLPEGTPFGLVGTSTFYRRDSKPTAELGGYPVIGEAEYDGLDAFSWTTSPNWTSQGSDAGKYANSDIYGVRILAMEPTTVRPYDSPNPGSRFRNMANERLRILGEIPLLKYDANDNPVLDADGNPDTSFLAKIPADVPFTFQTIDKDAMNLNMAQTWHQVRPGEVRHNCGGCHAHSQKPMAFEGTVASKASYSIPDLTEQSMVLSKNENGKTIVKRQKGPVDVEYYRDIKPILQRSCIQCHSVNGRQEAKLALDDSSIISGYEGNYYRLADDQRAQYGIAPTAANAWVGANQSRYVRAFQSRRSLLVWKVFGKRLDGWANSDHPTESVPGDKSTLPPSVNMKLIDIDFDGQICPPPASGVPALTEDEKMSFARWVDLGTPINYEMPSERKDLGWFLDELRPTVTMAQPKAGHNDKALDKIIIGMHDFNTDLDMDTFSVTANFNVNGKAAGSELASLFTMTGDHIWSVTLNTAITFLNDGEITLKIKDKQGNISQIKRSFNVQVQADNYPKLRFTSFAYKAGSAGSKIVFMYDLKGLQDIVKQVMFQLDADTAVEDLDKDGYFEFNNVAAGAHAIKGYLADAASVKISGSGDEISMNIQALLNMPPVVMVSLGSSFKAIEGQRIIFTIQVSDKDVDDKLQLTANLPSGAVLVPKDDKTWEFNWLTSNATIGSYNIIFRASDGVNYSQPVTVPIKVDSKSADTRSPGFHWALYSPWDGYGLTWKGSITLAIGANDDYGIAGIQFKVDGVNAGPEILYSIADGQLMDYSIAWDSTTVPNGRHTIMAVARDWAGNQSSSTSTTITVNN